MRPIRPILFALALSCTLTPFASLQYTHVSLDGYTETGAGDINLRVRSQSYDFAESGLGIQLARPFSFRSDTMGFDGAGVPTGPRFVRSGSSNSSVQILPACALPAQKGKP